MTQIPLPISSLNTFVEQYTKEAFYYSQEWIDLVTKLYSYSLIPLTTTDKAGQITGYLPLCYMQSPLTGSRLVSLPFSDYCPLLAVDDASADDLVDQAIRLAQRRKVKYLELRTGAHGTLATRTDLVESNLYVRWLLPLADDPDIVWSGLRKPVQHQIRKSRKMDVQIRAALNHEDMMQYYRLHLQTRSKKHGMPAQPQRFFTLLWENLAAKGALQVLLAEHRGKVIAGIVLLLSGTKLQYAYGASDESSLHLAPNNLLLWTAIEWGCTHGFEVFDFGRTAQDNEGLMEFKRRWGATKEPLPYYYYPHITGLASTPENSWKFRLLTSYWRKLPLSVSGPLGGYLYRHMG